MIDKSGICHIAARWPRTLVMMGLLWCAVLPGPALADEPAEVVVQIGHTELIKKVAFSPNSLFVVSGNDESLKLWEVASGRLIRTFRVQDAIDRSISFVSVSFSADGKYLLAGHSNLARIWDVKTGRLIKEFTNIGGPAVFAESGNRILARSTSEKKVAKAALVDVATGNEVRMFDLPSKWVSALAVSSDGRHVVAAGSGNVPTVKLWEMLDGRDLHTFQPVEGDVNAVAISPDGQWVAASIWNYPPSKKGKVNSVVHVWSAETGKKTSTFTQPAGAVQDVAFSRDGKTVATVSSSDQHVRLWDATTGKAVRTFKVQRDNFVGAVALSPDGRFVLSADFDIPAMWDTRSGRRVKGFESLSQFDETVVFAPQSAMALAGGSDGSLRLWDLEKGRLLRMFNVDAGSIDALAVARSGEVALAGTRDKRLVLWDLTTRLPRWNVADEEGIFRVMFSPDGRHGISVTNRGAIKVWNLDSGKAVNTFEREHWTSNAALSQDGKVLFVEGRDRFLALLDLETGKEVKTLDRRRYVALDEGHPVPGSHPGGFVTLDDHHGVETVDPKALAFAQGGQVAISVNDRGEITQWDLNTGQATTAMPDKDHVAFSYEAAVSSNKDYVVLANYLGYMKLFETSSGKELQLFTGQGIDIKSVVFSSDDAKILASSRGESMTRLWNVQSGREIVRLISFKDGEWVLITSKGYYNASPKGARHLSVRIGNTIHGMDRFSKQFHRPDIVAEVLRTGG